MKSMMEDGRDVDLEAGKEHSVECLRHELGCAFQRLPATLLFPSPLHTHTFSLDYTLLSISFYLSSRYHVGLAVLSGSCTPSTTAAISCNSRAASISTSALLFLERPLFSGVTPGDGLLGAPACCKWLQSRRRKVGEGFGCWRRRQTSRVARQGWVEV